MNTSSTGISINHVKRMITLWHFASSPSLRAILLYFAPSSFCPENPLCAVSHLKDRKNVTPLNMDLFIHSFRSNGLMRRLEFNSLAINFIINNYKYKIRQKTSVTAYLPHVSLGYTDPLQTCEKTCSLAQNHKFLKEKKPRKY